MFPRRTARLDSWPIAERSCTRMKNQTFFSNGCSLLDLAVCLLSKIWGKFWVRFHDKEIFNLNRSTAGFLSLSKQGVTFLFGRKRKKNRWFQILTSCISTVGGHKSKNLQPELLIIISMWRTSARLLLQRERVCASRCEARSLLLVNRLWFANDIPAPLTTTQQKWTRNSLTVSFCFRVSADH